MSFLVKSLLLLYTTKLVSKSVIYKIIEAGKDKIVKVIVGEFK